MTLATTTQDVISQINNRVDQLERDWSKRRQAVTRWYRLIRLENDLHQEGMESVIGNDPRSSYNLATWLLTPKTWGVTSFKDSMSDEDAQQAAAFDQMVEGEVTMSLRASRTKLHGSYMAQAIKNFVATGWLCLVSAPSFPHWTINAWHPMTVFPEYAGDGTMVELGRKWVVNERAANTMIFMEGWIPPMNRFRGNVTIRQWWVQSPFGVSMGTTMNDHLARPFGVTMFHRMPMVCTPAGGLPDDGTIMNDKWREDIGQSVVAAVADLQKNYDKMLTYMQQLLRDTANPKWVERVEGDGIINPEDTTKRGSVWTIGLGEDIWPVQAPGAPVDMRTHSFDIRNQIQRGTFQDTSFGGGAESAFLMANATASTKQLLEPFLDAFRDANGELITRNVQLAFALGIPIGGVPVPPIAERMLLDFNYDIEIPGDFLQRANSARILNPNFRLSQETLTELMFPEVKNPLDERLRIGTEDVANSEVVLLIKQITELRRGASQAHQAGDRQTEALLMGAADRQQALLLGQTDQEGEANTFRDMIEAGS